MNLLSIEITMTSLEVVDLINKFREEEGNRALLTHPHFMRDIRKEIKDLENFGIKKSTYKDKQNKERPCYILNYECINYLKNNSKHDIPAYCYMLDKINGNETNIEIMPATLTRKELLIKQVLLAWFDENQIYEQYPILNYRVDYYIPDCDLIIEYDEASGHKDIEKDNKRKEDIIDYLYWNKFAKDPYVPYDDVELYKNRKEDVIEFIRIKEYEENKGLNELFEYLTLDVRYASKLVNLNR